MEPLNEHIRFGDHGEHEEVPTENRSGNPAPRKRTRDVDGGEESKNNNDCDDQMFSKAQVQEILRTAMQGKSGIPNAKFDTPFGGKRKDNVEQWKMDVEDFVLNELRLPVDSEDPVIVSRIRPSLKDNALLQFQRWRSSMITQGKPRTWIALKEELWSLYKPKFQQRDMLYEFIEATVIGNDIEDNFTRLELLYNRMSAETQTKLPVFMILSKFPKDIRAYVDERIEDGDGLERIRELANTAARYHTRKPSPQQNPSKGKRHDGKKQTTLTSMPTTTVICYDCGGPHKRPDCKATASEKESFKTSATGKAIAARYEKSRAKSQSS